jgi:hypothetical protein
MWAPLEEADVSMTELALTHSPAETSPQVLRRRRETPRGMGDTANTDRALIAARHHHPASSERGTDRSSRFTFPAYRWRGVASAWMVMVVVVAALTAWMSLRVPHEVPPNHTLIKMTRPTPAETCSERDYANERC